MDFGGEWSKAIARSLKKLGVKNSYLVHGGHKSLVSKGLHVKELKLETSLTILNEEAKAILEDIKPTPTLVTGYGLISIVLRGGAVAKRNLMNLSSNSIPVRFVNHTSCR